MIANALCVNLDIVNATEHGMADVYEVRPSNTDVIDTVTIYRNKDHYDALVPVIAEPSSTQLEDALASGSRRSPNLG